MDVPEKAAVFHSNILHYSDPSACFPPPLAPSPSVIDIKVEAQAA